jgi:hypothetical protein
MKRDDSIRTSNQSSSQDYIWDQSTSNDAMDFDAYSMNEN